MAIRTVTIKLRIQTPAGKRYALPVYEVKGRLKPLYARVKGKPEYHPEGSYVLRIGSKWETVGPHTDVVMATKMRREQELEDAIKASKAAARQPMPVVPLNQTGATILGALESYLAKKAVMDPTIGKEALTPKYIEHVRWVVESFQSSCGKTFLREVTGEDFVQFFAKLRLQANLNPQDPQYTEKLRKRNTTVKGFYVQLHTFFGKHKINIAEMLEDEQIPRCKGRIPEAYTEAELLRLWTAAKPEEKIRLQFFVASGFRKQEVSYLTWDDVDLDTGIARVTPKVGWKPKNKTSREVMLPDWLVALLRTRRAVRPDDTWVFPSATGKVARHHQLLHMLKRVAKRAKVGGRVDLHKFRSTYASLLNKSGSVTLEEISGRLGHVDAVTTRMYLERMNQNTDRARLQSNETFAKLA